MYELCERISLTKKLYYEVTNKISKIEKLDKLNSRNDNQKSKLQLLKAKQKELLSEFDSQKAQLKEKIIDCNDEIITTIVKNHYCNLNSKSLYCALELEGYKIRSNNFQRTLRNSWLK